MKGIAQQKIFNGFAPEASQISFIHELMNKDKQSLCEAGMS